MSSRIECFWMEPTEMGRETLRLYAGESKCPGPFGYHNARVVVADVEYPKDERGLFGQDLPELLHGDERWPQACAACGVPFAEVDGRIVWQHHIDRLFAGAPDGKLYTSRDMPPGAMFDATWWDVKGPDGITLCVVLPPNGGDDNWMPDSPSTDGRPWTRTGTVPRVTCSPSILTPRYHGHLVDGWLVEC